MIILFWIKTNEKKKKKMKHDFGFLVKKNIKQLFLIICIFYYILM